MTHSFSTAHMTHLLHDTNDIPGASCPGIIFTAWQNVHVSLPIIVTKGE